MRKHNAKQLKLSVEGKCPTRQVETGESSESVDDHSEDDGSQDQNLRELLRDVKSGLKTNNRKLDLLTNQLDHIKQCVDKTRTEYDLLENRVCDANELQADSKEHLLCMDKVLDFIKAKSEDLDVRSHRNKLQITGLLDSTAIFKREDFIEILLQDLFDQSLSAIFIVEHAQCSLGPRPPLGAPPCPIQYQDNNISLYPEFTLRVQTANCSFLPVKKLLQKADIPYASCILQN
ncbi:hypothetical protein NDU88_007282 [Pleurodeles waltl]|uniref:Uncharacterized protein n=1 Tax=Pleurodeles waltl TaxID=8319 RepID=A0AAV7RPU3_PLEWA|nr:hypothetical protein NDU88_007282 [Pleurodeles waltl]